MIIAAILLAVSVATGKWQITVESSYRYSCKDKDASGKTETTIKTDFSETTTHGVMHGKTVFMHSTMKRLGDCD